MTTRGNHEFGLRSGTENIHGIVGFAEAVKIAMDKKQLPKGNIKKDNLKQRENFRCLIVNPPFFKLLGYGSKFFAIGPLYITTALNKRFYARFYDMDIDEKVIGYKSNFFGAKIKKDILFNLKHPIWKNFARNLKKFKPDFLGINIHSSSQFQSALNIAKIAKKIDSKITILAGGFHATIMDSNVLQNPEFDFVVRGEGEETVVELISCLVNDKKVSEVAGITFRKGTQIKRTASRTLIKTLDSIPYPDRMLILNKKNIPSSYFGAIMTSRGCSHSCNFCGVNRMWKKIRCRSPENILSEMEELVRLYKIKEITFLDDSFTVDKNRILKLCKLIIKKKLDIIWTCLTRIDLLDAKLIHLMKKSGCYFLSIGFESGSNKILTLMNKRLDLKRITAVLDIIKKEGLFVRGFFILGYPGESVFSLNKTYTFIRNLNLDSVVVFFATPFPGTQLYSFCKKNNLLEHEKFYEYNFNFPSVIKFNAKVKQKMNSTFLKIIKYNKEIESKKLLKLFFFPNYLRIRIQENLFYPRRMFNYFFSFFQYFFFKMIHSCNFSHRRKSF